MSNLTDFIGSKNNEVDKLAPISFITTSTSWTPPSIGKYFVILCGGGGSGSTTSIANSGTVAYGGGAGDMVIDIVDISNTTAIPITLGAGGSQVNHVVGGGNAAGNDGGISTFGSYLSTTAIQNRGITSPTQPSTIYGGFTSIVKSFIEDIPVDTLLNSKYSIGTLFATPLNSLVADQYSNLHSSKGANSIFSSGGGAGTTGGDGVFSSGGGGGADDYTTGRHSGAGGDGVCLIIKLK